MSVPSAFLGHLFVRKAFSSAGVCLLVYDFLVTFSLEVTYIWDSPWTIVKALFLANRYANLIGQTFIFLEETGQISHHSTRFCIIFPFIRAVFAIFSGESMRLLVVMRACAILRFKRRISLLASIMYVLCAVALLAASLHTLAQVKIHHFEYLQETGMCLTPVASHAWRLWLVPLVLDLFVLVIVLCSLYRLFQDSRSHRPSRLIRLLARDAFIFYLATLFNTLTFIVCWTKYRLDPRSELSTMISFPLLSVIGQRLVLNLRRLRARPDSTRDVSREIRRQMAAMGDGLLDSLPTPGSELEGLGLEFELEDLRAGPSTA